MSPSMPSRCSGVTSARRTLGTNRSRGSGCKAGRQPDRMRLRTAEGWPQIEGGRVATVQTAPGFVRQDGKEKVTGTGRYAADLSLTGMAHAKFRYADHSHAKILKSDTAKARALPGVVAVVTQADLPDVRFGGFVQDRYLF